MASAVKPRRPYDSSWRREQAGRTRAAIVEEARRLFLERGYAATTVASVAAVAGVSVETVYKAFGNKARLLKAAFDAAIVGDHQPVPMLQRELVQRINAEPDPRRKLSLYGEHLAEAGPRASALQLVARAAAASDPEAAGVWEQMVEERLLGMTQFARHLHEEGHLRAGISVDEARDVLWMFNSVELYDLLVIQRGWTPPRYGAWIAAALQAALLPAGGRQTDQ